MAATMTEMVNFMFSTVRTLTVAGIKLELLIRRSRSLLYSHARGREHHKHAHAAITFLLNALSRRTAGLLAVTWHHDYAIRCLPRMSKNRCLEANMLCASKVYQAGDHSARLASLVYILQYSGSLAR